MNLLGMSRLAAAIVGVVLVLAAKRNEAQQSTAQASQTTTKRVIVVSLEDRKLALLEDGNVKRIYTVAVGKASTPSPVGTFTIERRIANPRPCTS